MFTRLPPELLSHPPLRQVPGDPVMAGSAGSKQGAAHPGCSAVFFLRGTLWVGWDDSTEQMEKGSSDRQGGRRSVEAGSGLPGPVPVPCPWTEREEVSVPD